jgi:predicted DNA-binding protein (MmcQ/YjbR family)
VAKFLSSKNMDIEWLRKFCLALPATSEDIKWGNDLCFLVAGKMFCVAGLDQPQKIAFKVPDEMFEELSTTEGFIPAPYMARAKWVMVQSIGKLSKKEWEKYIFQSYTLVKNKLPKKLLKELGI